MAEALVCFSVIQNTASLLEQVLRILRRLRTAYERQKNLVDLLTQHEHELNSVKIIIGIIEDEEELHTDAVAAELVRLKAVQSKLKELLVSLQPPKTRGRINQIARQFVQGSEDERKLVTIMSNLGRVKGTLLLTVQVAQVGVMRNMQKELVANAEVIQRIDEYLIKEVSDCEGLRIARLLKDRCPSEDGTVPITAEELATLTRLDSDDGSEDGTLADDSETSPRSLPGKTGRDIDYNNASVESMQVNGPIETDIWKGIDHLSIRYNKVEGRAVQINHGITLQALKFLRDWQKDNIEATR